MGMTATMVKGGSWTNVLRGLEKNHLGLRRLPDNSLLDDAVVLDMKTHAVGKTLSGVSSQLNRTAEAIRAGIGHLRETNKDNYVFAAECEARLNDFMKGVTATNHERDALGTTYATLLPEQKDILRELLKDSHEGKKPPVEIATRLDDLKKGKASEIAVQVDAYIEAHKKLQRQLDALNSHIYERFQGEARSKLSPAIEKEANASIRRNSGGK